MKHRTKKRLGRKKAKQRRAKRMMRTLFLGGLILFTVLKMNDIAGTSKDDTRYWPEQHPKSIEFETIGEENQEKNKDDILASEDIERIEENIQEIEGESDSSLEETESKYSLAGTSYVDEDNETIIINKKDLLVLVNKERNLDSEYVPEKLIEPNVRFYNSEENLLREDAAMALEEMFQEAAKEGIELYGVSAYRSYEDQKQIFDSKVAQLGEEEARKWAAYPGQSEHQTGLAIDITGRSVIRGESNGFEGTKEAQWVAENSYKYGYILRYPKEKEDITEYHYEPWHIRYIGKEAAKEVFERKIALEELFEE